MGLFLEISLVTLLIIGMMCSMSFLVAYNGLQSTYGSTPTSTPTPTPTPSNNLFNEMITGNMSSNIAISFIISIILFIHYSIKVDKYSNNKYFMLFIIGIYCSFIIANSIASLILFRTDPSNIKGIYITGIISIISYYLFIILLISRDNALKINNYD